MPMDSANIGGRTAYALSRLNCLPAFNNAAVKLLVQPFRDEDSIADIEDSFRSDPGLASDLLVAANSAAMGLRARVATLRHALVVLGIDRIRSLVMTVATSSYMRQFPVEVVRPIWFHGIATGVIAEQLAGYSDRLCGPALYTAGLTHDLGRLGLLATERRRYASFLQEEYENRDESELVECDQFGVSHTVAGGLLTHLWGFPESLCAHAENHHEESSFDTEEDRIVNTACLLAHAMGYSELRLRSTPELEGLERLDDQRRKQVEERVQSFLS